MSATKHTPGAWSLPHFVEDETKCGCRHVLTDRYCGSICTIGADKGEGTGCGNDYPPLEEAKANARLIHAAPDLAAALRECMEDLHSFITDRYCATASGYPCEGRSRERDMKPVVAARAALKKAGIS